MTPSPHPALFVHDTRRIVSANAAALALFHCEAWEVVDRDLLDFVPGIYAELTKLNLYTTLKGRGTLEKVRRYDFVRCDGSVFAADVRSRRLDNGLLETEVTYQYEVRKCDSGGSGNG